MKNFLLLVCLAGITVPSFGQDPKQTMQAQVTRDKMKTADKNAQQTRDLQTSKIISPGTGPSAEPLDISAEVMNAKTKKGKQWVTNTANINLYALVENGAVKNYTAVNSSGHNLDVTTSTVVSKGKTRCRACVSDDQGTVCWWINCKDLPRPGPSSR